MTAVYDRHSYDREKREALEAWAGRLDEIVKGAQAPAGQAGPVGMSEDAAKLEANATMV